MSPSNDLSQKMQSVWVEMPSDMCEPTSIIIEIILAGQYVSTEALVDRHVEKFEKLLVESKELYRKSSRTT